MTIKPFHDTRTRTLTYVACDEAMRDAVVIDPVLDYPPPGRGLRYETSIGESRRSNVQFPADIARAGFVKRRTARERTLSAPRLLYQASR